jgi:hypothetical protein
MPCFLFFSIINSVQDVNPSRLPVSHFHELPISRRRIVSNFVSKSELLHFIAIIGVFQNFTAGTNWNTVNVWYDRTLNILYACVVEFFANIKMQHPVALRRSDFVFHFSAIYVQYQLIFSHRFLFIVTTYFGLTGHHRVYRLLGWRNLFLTVMLFCFSYVVASD